LAHPDSFHPSALRLSIGTFYFGQLGTFHFGATYEVMLPATFAQHDIERLDVPVQQPLLMRFPQGTAYLLQDVDHAARRNWPFE
jgi:hypothetical protein